MVVTTGRVLGGMILVCFTGISSQLLISEAFHLVVCSFVSIDVLFMEFILPFVDGVICGDMGVLFSCWI